MALPHFTNVHISHQSDVIYKSLVETLLESKDLDAETLSFLNYNNISLEKNILTFNINEDLKTYTYLNKIIKNKTLFNIIIKRYNKEGKIFMIIELINVLFLNFLEDIYDFNYNDLDILKFSVNITYEKRNTYTNIKKYFRTKKLEKIIIQ